MASTTIDYDFNGVTLQVEADVSPYVAAKTYGEAEDCHEAEGGEIEITSVQLNGVDFEYKGFITSDGDNLEELIRDDVLAFRCSFDEEDRY